MVELSDNLYTTLNSSTINHLPVMIEYGVCPSTKESLCSLFFNYTGCGWSQPERQTRSIER